MPELLKTENLPSDAKAEPDKELDGLAPVEENPQEEKQKGEISLAGEDQVPVGVNINGISREDGIIVYLPLEFSMADVMVPLGKISELLTFSITANPGDKKAEGFFLKEENVFQLDLNTMEVLVNGKKSALKVNEAQAQDDDIYVKASSLSEWFGIKINLDMSELVLDINSGGDLPFQERLKRLANAKKREQTFKYDTVRPDKAELAPYKNFSYPSFYLTNNLGFSKSSSDQSFIGFATLQGTQDIAKFEADYNFATRYSGISDREVTNARLTFQKRDPLRNLLGPLHAGRIAFGDTNFPNVPLFLGGQRGTGIEISSESRLGSRYVSNAENFILDGDAPVGYDAELYRNGSFIAFQTIGQDGRFSFENLNLTTGFNNFEIVLYGPQGQKTIIKREILRGPRQLRSGETQYDFAAGMPNSDFLPFSENADDDRTLGLSGQIFHGLSEFLTVGASVYSGPQEAIGRTSGISGFSNSGISLNDDGTDAFEQNQGERASGGALSASTSFLGMNFQGQILGADKGRRAYEIAATARPLGVNVGLSHTVYKNFLEDDQDIKSRSELSLYKNFGTFNTTFIFQDRDFLVRDDDRILESVLAFRFLGVNISNDLVRTFSDNENIDDFEGEFTAQAEQFGIRFRGALIYDLDQDATSRYRQLSFSGQKSLTARSSFRVEGIHQFDSKINALNMRLSRDYNKFGLDFDATATSDQNYTFTVGLRAALQPDVNNRYHLVDPRSGGLASLGVRSFIDTNNNGIFDNGEAPIEGVVFQASTNSDKATTDDKGVAYLTNLGEMPLRLSVNEESIPDIYLAPKFSHRDLIPRRGSIPVIDFPFVKMGEIAGYLTHLKQGVEGVIVKLLSVADGATVEETETDSDGYFIFPAIKGGNYKVSFGTKQKSDFLLLNVDLDASLEEQPELQVEASAELAEAAKEAAVIQPSAAARNRAAMNAPAGEMPNIDDPLNEEDLKPLDEKGIENIITQ